MPVSCSAVNCTNRYTKGSAVKFFVFPTDPERQKRWTVAVSRDKWLPSKYDHLCSAHFVSGRPSNIPDSIDYVQVCSMMAKRGTQPHQRSPDDLDGPARDLRYVKTAKNGICSWSSSRLIHIVCFHASYKWCFHTNKSCPYRYWLFSGRMEQSKSKTNSAWVRLLMT